MSAVEELSSDERQAFELISSEGELLQSELWKALDVNSREGSRIATRLLRRGLIEREETVHDGRVTYLLTPAETGGPSGSAAVGRAPRSERGPVPDLSPDERRALVLIQESGSVYQSELWKELGVSSREGSRIASGLVEKGLLEREETVHEGHTTYLLTPRTYSEELDFSLLMAGDMISPLVGAESEIDPIGSDAFTNWILNLIREGER